MRNPSVDHRTLENQLKQASGNDFCTFAHIHAVTGMTRKQVVKRLDNVVGVIEACPKLYPARQVAQAIVSWRPKKRR